MNRLIDEIQTEIQDKEILSKISHIVLSVESLDELITDFKEEFQLEYSELGREPSKYDVQEYLNVPIILEHMDGEEKYQLLTKI